MNSQKPRSGAHTVSRSPDIIKDTVCAPDLHLLSATKEELARGLAGFPAFRQKQVIDWIYQKHVLLPDEMTNLSKDLKEALKQNFSVELPTIIDQLESSDGSTKLLLESNRGQRFETVILRYEERTSLCVSTQVGCKMACSFCQTGKLGFFRNLAAHEILGQYFLAQNILKAEGKRISHVVFMGMGEPFDNYAATVLSANRLIDQEFGYGLSNRHVTVSTSGLTPQIISFGKDSRAMLAISLHAANDALRTSLMPINKKYSLTELKEALLAYCEASGKEVTIEYILIQEKNMGLKEAKELVRWLHGIPVKVVNLIPFNPHPGLPFERPFAESIRSFQSYLAERGYPSPVRYSKGLDVSGACGQLAAKVQETLHNAPRRKDVVSSARTDFGNQRAAVSSHL